MTSKFIPAYIKTIEKGQMAEKIRQAFELLEDCVVCPRLCHVDRTRNETGICRTGRYARVSSIHAHFGEESPLVGTKGSGTIFFTYCNLMCNFCQNWDISHEGWGEDVSEEELAEMMITLQNRGCHNINFVTPGHVVPQILAAVEKAVSRGLNLPLVFNSGGYDRVETLKLLDGVIDIYMPDFKFWEQTVAKETCNAPDYPEHARNALLEMHKQVGDLVVDADGLARRGLLIRHLVMPDDLAGTRQVMRFIAGNISRDSYVNIMSQYHPAGEALGISKLAKMPSPEEYRAAVAAAVQEGLHRFDRI